MSNISDNDIDKLFKEAAESYQTSFDESAWEDMERRMGDNGDDGFSYFKIIGGIIGVLMLGSIIIWNGSSEDPNGRNELNGIAQVTEGESSNFDAGMNNHSTLGDQKNTFNNDASEAYVKSKTADGLTESEGGMVENQASDNTSQQSVQYAKVDNFSASNHQKKAFRSSLSNIGEGTTVDTMNNIEGNNIEGDRLSKAQKDILKPLSTESGSVGENKESADNKIYDRLIPEKIKSTDPLEDKEGQMVASDIYLNNEREGQHKEGLKSSKDNVLISESDLQESDDESDLTGITNKEEENGYISTGAIKNGGGEINEDNADDDNVKGFVILEDEESRENSENSPFTWVYSPMLLHGFGYMDYQYPVGEGQLSKVDVADDTSAEASKYVNNRIFALKFTYSPDLTSIGYFKPDKPGSNFGIMGSYFIGRWSVSTGAIYSRKIYFTEESESYGYYSGGGDYSRIDGDCRVIDIPINISYYLSKNVNHSFYLSAGSSSYIMLKENYEYLSITNGTEKEWSQEVENENNHFFGILNLSIGYERRVNSNVFIQLEPFVKAPIAGIGEGKVDLVSTGAFLNLVYQFNRK